MSPIGAAIQAVGETPGPLPTTGKNNFSISGAGRERLLLDFGWRFHLGDANDPAKDLGFGSSRTGNFQKTGNFLPAGSVAYDDGDWRSVDLPHDWAVELPFQNDPALESKGFYPWDGHTRRRAWVGIAASRAFRGRCEQAHRA